MLAEKKKKNVRTYKSQPRQLRLNMQYGTIKLSELHFSAQQAPEMNGRNPDVGPFGK